VITRILELTIYINGTQVNIINSDINVFVHWDVEILRKEDSASLKYTFHSIYGNFETNIKNELFSKKSTYKFQTDESWSYSHIPYATDTISPTSAVINFDDKSIKIKF